MFGLTALLLVTTLRVSAAASLSDALTDLAKRFERETNVEVALNFGASNMLARQIEEGAPVDVFLSADEAKMDALAQHGRIVNASRRDLLANTLVVIVARDGAARIHSPRDLTANAIRRIAIGEPNSVPAGIYARQWLTSLGLWSTLAPKLVPVENVRAALAAVEAGNADAAIVYRTDALIAKRAVIGFEVPRANGPRIVYPVAIVRDSQQPNVARRFIDYLTSPRAKAVFRRYGFVAP